jgi:hypothetical protein
MMLNDVSKQIQRDNKDPRQVTLFYYKFREHEMKPGSLIQLHQKGKKESKELQAKLFS